MRKLTDKQSQLLDFIRDYVREHSVIPARGEMARAMGVHVTTIDARLRALEAKSWVELKAGSPRYVKLLREDLPLIIAGPIAAGTPILADEHVAERIPRSIAEWFGPRMPDFFVRVEGDSMDRLGIVTGTVVAVKSQPTAESGDVVVAKLEDEVTLKRFVQKDEKHAELLPESTNDEHQPIEVDLEQENFEIAGVAVGALIGDGFNRPEYESWTA